MIVTKAKLGIVCKVAGKLLPRSSATKDRYPNKITLEPIQ